MTTLCHYYHIYAAGNWSEPWDDQITAIVDSGLYQRLDSIKVGLVGSPDQQRAVQDVVSAHRKVKVVAAQPHGYEFVTLDVLYDDVMGAKDEQYILYGHTKGAAYFRPVNSWWRRDMIRYTIKHWKESIQLLDDGYDTTGIYWRRGPLGPKSPIAGSHFSGNFWWAKRSYLETLGPLNRNTRYDAEAWIGLNPSVKAYELHAGYPNIQGPPASNTPRIINQAFGPGELVTVYVQSRVLGPHGVLSPGTLVHLADSPYVQILIKSGSVIKWS